LARSTIASRIDALLASGLVDTAGEAASSGGRPPSRIAFNPTAEVTLAIDVGATHVRVAVTDLRGTVLRSSRAAMEVSIGPEHVLDWAMQTGGELLDELKRPHRELAGIGIGVPGPVEYSTGRPVKPPIMPGWDGFDIRGYVEEAFDTGVLVDNDVNIMALGEQAQFWPDDQDLLFVKVATGIGAGIISGGNLQRGAVGTAGDLGHVRVPGGEPVLCGCGNTGCLEALASSPAIIRRLKDEGLETSSSDDLIQLVRYSDLSAIRLLRQSGRDIGHVLATCVNLLNPSVIVIGGSLAQVGEHLIAGVREVVYQRSLPLATANLRIVSSTAEDRAGVVGASRMVIDHTLSPDHVDARTA
jgi:glucokinase